MKKISLLLVATFAFLFALSAQITQEAANEIVLEHISLETQRYTVYAKENVQMEGITITTSIGEIVELNYACWVYYLNYSGYGRYLIVNERNGNLLEVNVKNAAEPDEQEEWLEKWRAGILQYVKTELGGCNVSLSLRNDDSEIEDSKNDTINITYTKDSVNIFVGLTYTCKNMPFETRCEIVNDIIYMYLIDPGTGDYFRCPCYYTFDFIFKRESVATLNQKYKVYATDRKNREKLVLLYEGVIVDNK